MTTPPTSTARLRSGTVARLAGLPVTTLRVWERRYGVVAAPKTPTGQRLYSIDDVHRLTLLRQLTERGHAIGTIASLNIESLRELSNGASAAPGSADAVPRVVVVGQSVAQKLKTVWAGVLQAVHDDLEQAEAAAASEVADVILVHLPSLQPATAARVLSLAARPRAPAVIVVYAFGAEAVVESLRRAGATLRREPVTGRELGQLIAATRPLPLPAMARSRPAAALRYSEAALAGLVAQSSTVACECPRHVAEVVLQLGHFERYSAECSSRSPADAALHQHLSQLASEARVLMEQALSDVLSAEGVMLPELARP